MKQVKAIVRPEKLSDIRYALETVEGYGGITITEVMGQGIQKGIVRSWRGEKYEIDLIPKVSIELVVKDEILDQVTKIILEKAYTGEEGDGKIFISNVEDVIRIRTKESGEDALY
ncbi:P-II family nitrogen regulator [Lachnospiraceae bacterium MD1]|jgi:nitrogen regulatory protein P-II 1|uniref:P-II family nitrogen regulator n=1 Tax=Variimorphobacter saccharofermentans TaxID=2755051 RepID=A0A839K1V0_9FIRM|nr:P-II family nitrogen regulator [Variimorphobacter saccharofermentans]MBB2183387.1 P-II family nitrogen regulator [Variimorphobacter saccharofermentans]